MSSLKEQLIPIKNELENLLSYANEATGQADTDLGEAIRTLVDGYGQGGESNLIKGSIKLTSRVTGVLPITVEDASKVICGIMWATKENVESAYVGSNIVVSTFFSASDTDVTINGSRKVCSSAGLRYNGTSYSLERLASSKVDTSTNEVAFGTPASTSYFENGVTYNYVIVCEGGQGSKTLEIEYTLEEDYTSTSQSVTTAFTNNDIQLFFDDIVGTRGSFGAGNVHIFKVTMKSNAPTRPNECNHYEGTLTLYTNNDTSFSTIITPIVFYTDDDESVHTANMSYVYLPRPNISCNSDKVWRMSFTFRTGSAVPLTIWRAGTYKFTLELLKTIEYTD